MENFAEAKISLRGESGEEEEERKFFNESFQQVRELIKKIYSTRSKRELDLIDPTWTPTFIAIHPSLSLSFSLFTIHRNKYKNIGPFDSSLTHSTDFESAKEILQGSRFFFKNSFHKFNTEITFLEEIFPKFYRVSIPKTKLLSISSIEGLES